MKLQIQNKVYKVTFGATPFPEKDSQKAFVNSDYFNIESLTVLAKDVYDALDKISPFLLKREKEGLKNCEQVWVESVELLAVCDDLD